MHVSPINKNINFDGKFKRTPVLEKIIKNADNTSLYKFNEIINRASKINDGFVFEFREFPSKCARKTYSLHRENIFKNYSSIIAGVMTKINNSVGSGVFESEVLAKFLPILEGFYPSTYNGPRKEILENIEKNLID